MSILPPRPDVPPSDLPVPPESLEVRSGPPKATWRWWEILLIGFGALIVGTIPAIGVYVWFGVDPTTTGRLDGVDFLANAVDQIVIVVLLVGYLAWRHRGWRRAVRLPSPRGLPREVAVGLVCGVGMAFALDVLVSEVLEPIFRAVTDRDVIPAEQVSAGIAGWEAVVFVLAVAVVAPVAEEFFYRGLFFRALRDRYNFWVGAIGSGLLFGLSHSGAGDLAEILLLQIAIGVFGVVLAALYEWRGSLGANVAAHAAFNLVTVVTVLAVS